MSDAQAPPRASAANRSFSINKPFFVAPPSAGRKITAGFSYLQRIGKSASIDVWFPEILRQELDALIAKGKKLGPKNFPAEWAAVRQFELLQEAGNYKIYDMDATDLIRTLRDLAHNMRGGGYRVTVVSIGSYAEQGISDELEILDKRLQDRISRLTHMMYLEEQSEGLSSAVDKTLAKGCWDYRTELPHIGMTLGARDLFRPSVNPPRKVIESFVIPSHPHKITVPDAAEWAGDLGVIDADYDCPLRRIKTRPQAGEFIVENGVYHFAAMDTGRNIKISYLRNTKTPPGNNKSRLAQHFFDILSLLPQKHIVHDVAVGMQLPELLGEHEWIYVADKDMQLGVFNTMLNDLFEPFGKGAAQHMRGYGDHMKAAAGSFYRDAAASLYSGGPN